MKNIPIRKVLFITSSVLTATVVVIVFVFSFSSRRPLTQGPILLTPTPIDSSNVRYSLVSVVPNKTTTLAPNQKETFTIQLNNSVNLNLIKIVLQKKDVTRDSAPSPVPFTTSIIADATFTISMQENIQPVHEYTLLISHVNDGSQIVKTSYLSADIKPSPLRENNQFLAQYLPYEIDSFKLSYNSTRNLYVFNFKYNATSQQELQVQYERAKDEANKFIQSKNINPSTVIIEWRYH